MKPLFGVRMLYKCGVMWNVSDTMCLRYILACKLSRMCALIYILNVLLEAYYTQYTYTSYKVAFAYKYHQTIEL